MSSGQETASDVSPGVHPSASPSTVDEIANRLRELELRYLPSASSTKTTSSSPFAPVSSLRQRIQSFQVDRTPVQPQITDRKDVLSRLPPVTLPTFDGSDLDTFLKDWQRWLRLSGVCESSEQVKLDWLLESCTPKVKKLVEKVIDESKVSLIEVLLKLETLFPRLENDITLRSLLDKLPQLPISPEPAAVAQLLVEIEELLARLSENTMSYQEKFLLLVKNCTPNFFGVACGQILQASHGRLLFLETSPFGKGQGRLA
jgi:hypothetical protein